MLRAKQMGLSIAELDQMEEGAVMDMLIEPGNDACSDEYCQVADQRMMKIVYLSAVSPCKTVASIYIPCSVKAYGGLRRPPNCPEKNDEFREVTICDFTDSILCGEVYLHRKLKR